MEITKTIQTPNQLTSSVRTASGFGMPIGGQSCFGSFADARTPWIDATALIAESMTAGASVRDRKDLAAKGHVALVAYVPGHPAWSPPIC